MSKFFLNIFFVIIMGLCLTVVPINIDLLDFENINFDFSKFKAEEDQKNDTTSNIISVFEPSYESGTYLYNPTTLDITIKSVDDLSMYPEELKNNLLIDIFKSENPVSTVKLNSINSQINLTNNDDVNILTLSIPIDMVSLNRHTGHFKLKINSNSKSTDIFKNLEYNVTYIDDYKYILATNDNLSKDVATIYYPDKELKYSVPVSREVSSRRNSQIRSILNAILEGPSIDSGLKEGPAGPYISSAAIRSGVLTLKSTSSDVSAFGEGEAIASSTLDTIINSLCSLPNVDEINFLINGSSNGTYFNGTSIKDGFTLEKKSMAYLGYQTSNEYNYLLPIPYGSVDELDVEAMLNTLKDAWVSNEQADNLLQTVPQNVKLINYDLTDEVLTLNFSKEFLDSYNSNEDYSMLMLDSLVYSYTSYDKIKALKILVEDKEVNDFFGIDISAPMESKLYINPRFN